MKTPVQRAGFKIGDKFRILESVCGFTKGQIVTLNRDDGSRCPLFKGENSQYTLADRMTAQGAFIGLDRVELFVEPEFKIGDRVKVARINGNGFYRSNLGKIGTIVFTDRSALPAKVRFDGGSSDWGCFDELDEVVVMIAPRANVAQAEEVKAATLRDKLAAIDTLVKEVRELVG